ncbi:MAG TPA: FHA domain-containing protein, partial [Vicinamibacteria bacterium]
MIAVRLLADGVVVREVVFRGGAFVIGRAPESDFVIVDPTLSRRHALVRTDESGGVWIEDAESRNGLWVGDERVAEARLSAVRPTRFRLGAVELELALSSADATESLARPPAQGPRPRLRAVGLWAAGVAAGALALLIEPGFWSPWDTNRWTTFLRFGLGMAVGLPVLAFVLVGLLRVVGRKVRVSDALSTLCLLSWGSVLVSLVLLGSTYALSVRAHSVLVSVVQVVATVVIVASLASIARPGPRLRFFASWAAIVTLMMVGFGAVGALAARQAGMPELDYGVAVPILGLTGPATDVETYLRVAGEDFASAENGAADELRRSE